MKANKRELISLSNQTIRMSNQITPITMSNNFINSNDKKKEENNDQMNLIPFDLNTKVISDSINQLNDNKINNQSTTINTTNLFTESLSKNPNENNISNNTSNRRKANKNREPISFGDCGHPPNSIQGYGVIFGGH